MEDSGAWKKLCSVEDVLEFDESLKTSRSARKHLVKKLLFSFFFNLFIVLSSFFLLNV
jgi:hypothetical protein